MALSRPGAVSKRLALAVLLASMLVLASALPAAAAPAATSSYYVRATDSASDAVWFDYGCAQGRADEQRPGAQNRIVILDFGAPMLVNGVYGFDLPGGATGEFRSRLDAASAAVHFARGYRGCTAADRASTITLAIGTTNRGTQVRDNGYQQGRAFANFVRSITSQVAAAGASGQVTVTGAIDVEMDWNTFGDTREWYLGYDSLSNTTIYNFGDAAGCTQDGSTTACNNGWTQERVWWVSEGFALAHPLPEIYTNSGSMARQWYQLARYTDARHSADMVIAGTLTQFGACQQVGGCTTTDNTPSQGWTQLFDLLNADPAVRHRPRWSADIRYSSVLGLAAAPPTGIVDDVQGALPTSTARLLNAWQGRAGGGFVSVYAGAAAGDADQGVVVVVTLEDARHPTLGQQLVKTPSRSGALRVTAANGSLLTLQAEGGTSFTFDIAARRFR